MKSIPARLGLSSLILIPGCAGPMGPPLGLGPGWDELAGMAIVALIASIMYRPLWKFFSTRHSPTISSSPPDIIKLRFARGEITQEEYQRMMQHLS